MSNFLRKTLKKSSMHSLIRVVTTFMWCGGKTNYIVSSRYTYVYQLLALFPQTLLDDTAIL